MKKKKNKKKIVYVGDNGQALYSMAALNGKTPEEQEAFEEKRKSAPYIGSGERSAMIKAAFSVYGPLLLIVVSAFGLTALLLYLFLT